MADTEFPHLFVTRAPENYDFTSHQSGRDNINFPDRTDRAGHANFIRTALDAAWASSRAKAEERASVSLPTRNGTYIEFRSAPDFDLRTKSLDLRQSNIRLLNVVDKIDDAERKTTYATIFVPEGKESILLRKIDQYESEETRSGRPKNEPLVASIDFLREAVLQSFWRDRASLIPTDPDWCEVWLRYSDSAEHAVESFSKTCDQLGLETREGYLSFPERAVSLVKASSEQLNEILLSCDTIAEFRKAKTTAGVWMNMDNSDQSAWASDLAERVTVDAGSGVSACILDTGVNNGHILLEPLLRDQDCHSVNLDWDTTDEHGHGTLMCGIVGYGNEIGRYLQSTESLDIPFVLESVKLIPSPGSHHEKRLYGLRTKQAVSRAEVERPQQVRAICLSVTSDDQRDEGRPSSWSGSIDQLCAGSEDETRRLVFVSSGNNDDPNEWKNYPDSNITTAVHDPGQAWNVVTVGALTEKTVIADDDLAEIYRPIAAAGQLSPFSTTSHLWDKKWPNKPDVVFEGGNAAIDANDFTSELDDLSILSTHHNPQESQFSLVNATSAAAAQAAHLGAQLLARYPNSWPETIRALVVHSATWTDGLKGQFCSDDRTDKQNHGRLLRTCGYGQPDFRRAMESASNSLTLIVEQEIQPFRRKEGSNEYETNEMHLVDLPWPIEALGDLPGETEVRIDVTLSYFIEPGPGEIGWRDKYRYRSHGLDFDLIGPSEDKDEFLKKLNKAALTDGDDHSGGSAIDWSIGSQARNRGSVHRDWWLTTAANAAQCSVIGVYPRTGWWKERSHLDRGSTVTRYSLVVTVTTPAIEVDIYTPVANAIEVAAQITTGQ